MLHACTCTTCATTAACHPPHTLPLPSPRTEGVNKPSQHMASVVSYKLSSSASNLETSSGPSTVVELRRQLVEAGHRYQEASQENGELRAQLASSAAPPTFRGVAGAERMRQELSAEEKVSHVVVK